MPENKKADAYETTLKLLDAQSPDDDIQRRFEEFHRANPHVYQFLVKFTKEAVPMLTERGIKHYGIAAVVERARWHINFETRGYEDFKISNDYRSRYARLIMQQEPSLRGVFFLRPLRSIRASGSKGPGAEISVSDLVALLELVDAHVTEEMVRTWSVSMRAQAAEWASALHYKASDNDQMEVPEAPAFIPIRQRGAPLF